MEASDCAAACLAMVLAYHGRPVAVREAGETLGTGRDSVQASVLIEAARSYGLDGVGVRAELEELRLLPRGAILHWNFNHFVVLQDVRQSAVEVIDPAHGRRRVRWDEVGRSFTGVAVILEPGSDFQAGGRLDRRRWRYLRVLLEQRVLLRRVLVSSLLIRLASLAAPLLTAAVVDRVLPGRSVALLIAVAVAALALAAYASAASFLRAHLLLHLQATLDSTLAMDFVRHLADQPYAFFLTRSTGDLLMRLRSNAMVRELLTTNASSTLIDGAMAGLYLLLLLGLDWRMGLLGLVLGGLQVLVLALFGRWNQLLLAQSLEVQARSQHGLYEIMEGIETIKAAGAERLAVDRWSGLYSEELDTSLERGRLDALVGTLIGAIRIGAPIAVLTLGAMRVMSGELTLGTMLAGSALAAGFLEPLAALVAAAFQLQLLGGYMDRINDVLDSPKEQASAAVRPAPPLRGAIVAERLHFRYAPRAALAIADVSVEVACGQHVAIVGASGSGKSTLARLLLGLYVPSAGRVLYDGLDLAGLDAHSVRAQIGAVTQDSSIFDGSVRDNIAFSDPDLPMAAVERAARLACFHEVLAAMPGGYETMLVGGGATLSGGERQRLALARALAPGPRVLLLDEATSALDATTEWNVHRNLAALECTILLVAHRLSTVVSADLILVMDGGRVVERGTHAELLRLGGFYHALVANQTFEAGSDASGQTVARSVGGRRASG